MGLKENGILSFFLVNIRVCPHQVAPPVKIMPRPFFHESGIALGTTCDKVPMTKMITGERSNHNYSFVSTFFNEKWNASETPP